MWIRQWTSFSCGAAVFQLAVKFFTDVKVGHWAAIRMLKCWPHGTHFTTVLNALRRYGVTSQKLDMRRRQISRALGAGKLILIDDAETYTSGHFSMVTEEEGPDYWVYDPILGVAERRSKAYVLWAASRMYALNKSSRPYTA